LAIDSTVKSIAEDALKDFNFHYFRINKGGRAAAHNYGIRHARANLLLLYGCDFIATPELLEHHVRLHQQISDSKLVGIGPALFPSKFEITPFMRWLEQSGTLFGAPFSSTKSTIPEEFFYGVNTSIKKDLLDEVGPFDEQLPYHAVDDYEIGRRLFERGMRTVFLPRALAYHDHQISMRDRRQAMKEAGASTAILESKNPNFVTRDHYHEASRRPTGIVRLLAGWHRTKYFLLGREEELWKYFGLSMTQAWVGGYRNTKRKLALNQLD
jgi:GT2 family glycosyltransferase